MKKIAFLIFTTIAMLTACEEKLPLYSDHQAYLNFDIKYKEDTLVNYSFVFSKGLTKDTVWIRLNTMGYLSNKNRPFKLKQVAMGKKDAVPGKHYIALDSKQMQQYLFIPANKTYAYVPVIVLKHPTLDNDIYSLRIKVEDNGTFNPGYREQNFIQIDITSKLNKPTQWSVFMNYFFGKWGPVKHQFMMDVTGKTWDDNFLKSLFKDQNYTKYLVNKLTRALEKKNEQLKAKGKPILKEADGTIVAFGR